MKITEKHIKKLETVTYFFKQYILYFSSLFLFTYSIMGMGIIHGEIYHFTKQKAIYTTTQFSVGIALLFIIVGVVINLLRKSFSFPILLTEMFAYFSVVVLFKYTDLAFQVNAWLTIIFVYVFMRLCIIILKQ